MQYPGHPCSNRLLFEPYNQYHMQLELFSEEANKIWKQLSSESRSDQLQPELYLYQKLLNFFQVGAYYYYLFNFQRVEFDLVSKEIETVLGYHPSEVTLQFLLDKMHPDDRSWFLSFENRAVGFLAQLPRDKLMKYKARYDLRFQKKDGNYIRVLHHVAIIQADADGRIIRTLGLHTDITHLKAEGKPVMSLIGMDGEPSYLDIDVENTFVQSKEVLTRREKEVLTLLIEGKLSKEISSILHISKQTVDTHRKNMLRKNQLNNMNELISKAIGQGWI